MIDVSHYQGPIDFAKVKQSGVERVMIKLGEDRPPGEQHPIVDPYGVLNVHHARAVGLQVGLYYFAHPGTTRAHDSAERLLELAGSHLLPGDLPPALDLEVEEGLSLGALDVWKAAWFSIVDPVIHDLAMFYSFRYFLNAFTINPNRPIWGAHPGQISAGERARWSFWQYGLGRVPGITGQVDLDDVLHPDTVPTIPAV